MSQPEPFRADPSRRHPPSGAPRRDRLDRGRVTWLLALAGLLTVGCGAQTDGGELAVLADRADRLAGHLDAGDDCAAEDEIAALVRFARDGAAAGRLDGEVVAHVEDVALPLRDELACTPPPPDGPAPVHAGDLAERDDTSAGDTPDDTGGRDAPDGDTGAGDAPGGDAGSERRGSTGNGNGNGAAEPGERGRSGDGPPPGQARGRGP